MIPEAIRIAYVFDLITVGRQPGAIIFPETCLLAVTPAPGGVKQWGKALVVNPAQPPDLEGPPVVSVDAAGNVDVCGYPPARVGPDAPGEGFWLDPEGVESAIIELTESGWAFRKIVYLPGFEAPAKPTPAVCAQPPAKPKRRRRKKADKTED